MKRCFGSTGSKSGRLPVCETKRCMRSALILIPALALFSAALAGCSKSPKNQPVIIAAGDKATVGQLVYTVTDTQRTQTLGEDPNTARTAQNRFYLVKVSVLNSGADDQPIPAMTLVDDQGQSYPELADGTGVPNWLGVVRKVGSAQTEQGNVVFDAPTKHYRLRLTDPSFDEREVSIDIPLDFTHEQQSLSVQIPALTNDNSSSKGPSR
jgi:hypothetical protein